MPEGLSTQLIYGCSGPRQGGVCFRLRLPYRDETRDPASPAEFDHEWVVSRHELDQAESMGRSDQELLARRDREARTFLSGIERSLRRERLRLERVGRDLVLRRSEA